MITTYATELYAGGNYLQGYTLGVGQNINETFGFRAEFNYLNYSRSDHIASLDWDTTLKNSSIGLFADYHPFDGDFRITGGAAIGRYKLSAHAIPTNGYYTINGTRYYDEPGSGEYLNGSAKLPLIRSYLGFGWGHSSKQGFGFALDAGVYYGRFKTKVDTSPNLTAVAASDIQSEQQDAQDYFDKHKFMPSIVQTLTYSF